MILEFSFSSVSNNGILENLLHKILHKIIHKLPINGSIVREKNRVFLYVEGEEEELKFFSDELSGLLPLSLFFSLQEVKVVEKLPQESQLNECNVNLPFTNAMLQQVLDEKSADFYNPFLAPEVGSTLNIQPPLIYKDEDGQLEANLSSEFQNLIKKTALHVSKGKSLHVNTRDGIKRVTKLDENSLEVLKNSDFYIMPTDLSLVEKAFIADENEIQALASLEKPTLHLRANLMFKNKNILPENWADVKISDTILLFLLCKELFSEGVEFIAFQDEKEADISLTHKQGTNKEDLHVNILENKAVIPLKPNEFLYHRELPHFEQKSHEKFITFLYEYELFQKKSSCFYLSKEHDDKIMTYSEKLGLVELVSVETPMSIEDILTQISNIDEGGAKLVANYKKEYSKVVENALHVKVPKDAPKNFYTLLGVVGVLFSFGNDIKSAADVLLRYAKDFAGPKGPRIDVKMHNNGFPETIDMVKFVRSGLSFRLAGVDNEILSYGYLESIAYFVSDAADIIEKEFETTHVCLSGELFSFKRLLETSAKNIQPNHKVCVHRAFALDG